MNDTMKRVVLFIVTYVLWIFLTWPFDLAFSRVYVQDLLVGLVVALVVAVVMKEVVTEPFSRFINPLRLFWFILYLLILAWDILKANFDVAYRVLHPDMPIRPGVVKVKTKLTSASGISVLANSITLTPGTLTVEATKDGYLYVHWINIKSTDIEEATKHIVSRFEGLIMKVFE